MAKQPVTGYFAMPWHVEMPIAPAGSPSFGQLVCKDEGVPRQLSVELLDTPDERLRRCGVRFACTTADARVGWFVWAAGWQPWIPAERSASLSSDAEMPDEVAEMVRPFVRGAALSPRTRIVRLRSRYVLQDLDGQCLARILDDRITLRREGESASRVREMTLDTTGLGPARRQGLVAGLEAAGATPIAALSELFSCLEKAAPLPAAPKDAPEEATLAQFVEALFASHLHALLVAALTVRSGVVATTTPLVEALTSLRAALLGLRGVLVEDWRAAQLAVSKTLLGLGVGEVDFRGDFQRLADALDQASLHAPVEMDPATRASALLGQRVRQSVERLDASAARALSEQGGAQDWIVALDSARIALSRAELAHAFLPHGARTLRALAKIVALLACAAPGSPEPSPARLAQLSPQEAFGLGQAVERSFGAGQAGRERFREQWAHRRSQLARSLTREDTRHR
ncbi:hypothetical protein SAMN05443377_10983 [Propionibacterium cyclohexanicum]|uniref:CHAD domain-containing protein n=1 Tax=Propionibacterium cyclohexanicum TaxID=64702 RepID=A0A1H9RVV2_9ACTN|nr:hypothetical protein [Propionibacterium cyclohexanicum]SER76744.1 hypothetical protein SAMN05443377_10983 [Propionibacterium cyclohexanicum]